MRQLSRPVGREVLHEQKIRSHRVAAPASIDCFALAIHRRQQQVNRGTQLSQRLCLRHSLFKADVADHRPLKVMSATHRTRLNRWPMDSDRSARRGCRQALRNGLLIASRRMAKVYALRISCIAPARSPWASSTRAMQS